MRIAADHQPSARDRVIEVLTRYWKAVVVFLVVIALAMAAVLIMQEVGDKRRIAAVMLAEEIQESYVQWTREDAESREDDEITALIDEAISEHPRTFAAQRAIFTRAMMFLEKEEWENAAASFREVAQKWEKSYLAPVSLFNAGSALEQAGDAEGAVELLTQLVETYPDTSSDIPESLFNLGRLAEGAGDTEKALEHYREIGSRFPESRWKDLAKTRILIIEG